MFLGPVFSRIGFQTTGACFYRKWGLGLVYIGSEGKDPRACLYW